MVKDRAIRRRVAAPVATQAKTAKAARARRAKAARAAALPARPGLGAAGAAGAADAANAGAGGEGGAIEAPAQNNSAVSFVSTGAVSKSNNFILISGLGESLGGTVGSKRSKSLKYTYIPGVIAASSP